MISQEVNLVGCESLEENHRLTGGNKVTASVDTCLEKLAQASRADQLIVFCGAGISKPSPTNLPTADDIVCNVLEQVVEAIPDLEMKLVAGSYLFRNAPFELFMAVIEQGLLWRVFEVLEPLTDGEPNALHRYLAGLLVSRRVSQIITTNFDDMLEQAIELHGAHYAAYYSWKDIDEICRSPDVPALVKVHGSFLDTHGQDITLKTVLTTFGSIYRGSTTGTMRKWVPFLEKRTLLFLGCSGRDRIDVLRLLSFLRDATIVWVDHSDNQQLETVAGTPTISEGLTSLLRAGSPSITLVSGHTGRFLDLLEKALPGTTSEGNKSIPTGTKPRGKPLTFMPVFRAPLFPNYAGLVGGNLFLWCGWAREAGYALGKYFETYRTDGRIDAHAMKALGQVYELMDDRDYVERCYTTAIRTLYGLGDYPGLVTTLNYFADYRIRQGDYDSADRLLFEASMLASREGDEAGTALSQYNLGRLYSERGDRKKAFKSFSEAATLAASCGDFWTEAGALQALVQTEHKRTNRYSEEMLNQCLTVLENIYWLGGGSAPSIKVASMSADTFELYAQIAEAARDVKGRRARAFLEANDLLARVDAQGNILAKLRLLRQ